MISKTAMSSLYIWLIDENLGPVANCTVVIHIRCGSQFSPSEGSEVGGIWPEVGGEGTSHFFFFCR